jgi:hypothetical protein
VSRLEVLRVGDGLWRWGAPLAGGGETAYSTYLETRAATVLFDPVVPPPGEDADRFWRALDRDVERAGTAVVVALTSERHRRGEPAIRRRYGAARARAGAPPPAGVVAIAVAADEQAFLVAAHRALVVGDAVRGTPHGPAVAGTAAAAALRGVAGAVDVVLPAHGPPTLAGAGAALAAAARAVHPSG